MGQGFQRSIIAAAGARGPAAPRRRSRAARGRSYFAWPGLAASQATVGQREGQGVSDSHQSPGPGRSPDRHLKMVDLMPPVAPAKVDLNFLGDLTL